MKLNRIRLELTCQSITSLEAREAHTFVLSPKFLSCDLFTNWSGRSQGSLDSCAIAIHGYTPTCKCQVTKKKLPQFLDTIFSTYMANHWPIDNILTKFVWSRKKIETKFLYIKLLKVKNICFYDLWSTYA